jgi:dTDP-4-dehydrorhamnose reductase
MLAEPVVVLGAAGMLGRATLAELSRRGLNHRGLLRAQVDLARPETIEAGLPRGTGSVINCAGWTNVDAAESQEAEATAVNGRGVGELAARCKAIGALLVHYSTDYVFAGKASAPYATDQPRAPLNAYGRSKAAGEELLEQSGARHLLLRTSWVYAPWGKNFVRTIARLAGQRPSLSVVNDQLGRPSSAEQIARVTLELMSADALGAFHVSDDGQCTWFEFAQAIVAHTGAACRVEPCSSDQFPSPAVRPSYSVLDLSRTRERVPDIQPWQHCLGDVMRRLEPL